MPRINVHLDDVESGFEVYPDDRYIVQIQESSKIKKSDAGVYILWIAKVLEGEYEDKMISWNTSLQPQALWNLKAMLKQIEVEWDEDGFEMEDAYGKELIVVNKVRQFEGEDRNNIVAYHKI